MWLPSRLLAGCLALLLGGALPALGAATPAAAVERFDIMEYQIDGNTVLPTIAVERAVYRHLGPGLAFGNVEAARAALEKAYQDSGYLSVSVVIPEQKVGDGIVRLQVVEGAVESLKISGNRYFSRGEIRAQVPELAPGNVPYFPAMQAQLGDLSRTPDRRVTPLLRPGKTPGKMEVELAVEDQLPLHGSIELNNRQSPSTTASRLEASLRYDNLFQKQHSVGINFNTSPQKTSEVQVISGFYAVPLPNGLNLSLSALRSDSNIISGGDSGVVGKGDIYGVRLTKTLPGLASDTSFFHTAAFGIDVKRFEETQNVLGADSKVSPLRYVPFSVQYTLGSLTQSGDLLGNFSYVFGARGSSQRLVNCQGVVIDQFECRRAGARSNFSYLRGDLSLTKRHLGWEYTARTDFQLAGQPLVSNEQFLAGGMDSVRGYYEGEAAGDHGWRLRTEVKSPSVIKSDKAGLKALGFLDAASLGLQEALPGQTDRFRLFGGGLGLRLAATKHYELNLDWGHAMRAGPRTASGSNRIHVRFRASF